MIKKINKEFQLINRRKLKGLLVERGQSVALLAEDLKITKQQLYLKLSGEYQFSENEIFILKRNFGNEIFFN